MATHIDPFWGEPAVRGEGKMGEQSKPKPTIEELEKILNSDQEPPIVINPDGSVSVLPTEGDKLREQLAAEVKAREAAAVALGKLTGTDADLCELGSQVSVVETLLRLKAERIAALEQIAKENEEITDATEIKLRKHIEELETKLDEAWEEGRGDG